MKSTNKFVVIVSKVLFTFLICAFFIGQGFAQDTEELVSMSLEDLLNMEVITVSKSSEKLSDAPGVISVVSKQEIQMFGGTTLKDILERVPGLIGSTVYMTDRSTLAPRGDQVLASSSHVLFLINGRPVRESLEGGIKSEIYESFPVNVIEKIEVIRGPGSVLYGSNAFSAVINVITQEAEKTGVEVMGLAGQDGAYGGLGKVTLKTGDFSLIAAGREFEKAEWETEVEYGNYYHPMLPSDTTLLSNVTIPNKGRGAYLGMNFKDLKFMGSYTKWEHSYFVNDYATVIPVPTYGDVEWEKLFANLGYSLIVTEKWNMDFNVTYNKSTFETASWPSSSRNSYEVVGEWTNFMNPVENLGIVFGGLYNYFQGKEETPSDGVITNANRYSVGAYVQLDYRVIEKLKLIGGVQANKVEKIDLNAVPRLGVIWNVFDRLNVKALYSQAFRAPSINELSLDFPQMQGNPNLTPEKVSTVDLGINYQGEKGQAGINFFYSDMKDLIYQDRSGAVPTYMNGDQVTFQGVELEGKYYITRNLLLIGSTLYQENENKAGEENVTPIANLGAKFGIGYTSENGFDAGIFNVYQADLDKKYDSHYNPSTEAYNLLNAHLKYNLNNLLKVKALQNLCLFIQADNILDEELWLPDWGLLPGKTIPVNQGRAIYVGLSAAL
jgi:outer membrane receptor for ferrienterochelin and colicins